MYCSPEILSTIPPSVSTNYATACLLKIKIGKKNNKYSVVYMHEWEMWSLILKKWHMWGYVWKGFGLHVKSVKINVVNSFMICPLDHA
jgi:hypothetical protein